jgi:Tfp pilus assembly protein PilZ
MFIATERPLPPDTQVSLRFRLPDSPQPLAVRGRVAWVSGDDKDPDVVVGMGVQYLNLEPSAAAAIGALVDRLTAEALKEASP